MPKRFIHFCGHSGVGKKTLIKKLLDDSMPGLRGRFGIEGSIGAYGHYPGVKEMFKYINVDEDNVIHNWQFATHGWIAHNDRAYPGIEQRIYLLWRPYDIHSRHLAERADTYEPGTFFHTWRPTADELRGLWNREIVPPFRQVQGWGLNVEVVDASTECYEAMSEWPS